MNIIKGILERHKGNEAERFPDTKDIEQKEKSFDATRKQKYLSTVDDSLYLVDKETSSVTFLKFKNDNRKILHLSIEGLSVNIDKIPEADTIRLTTLIDLEISSNTINILYMHNREEIVNKAILRSKCKRVVETITTDLEYLNYGDLPDLKELKITECTTIAYIQNTPNLEKLGIDEVIEQLDLTLLPKTVSILNIEYCNYLIGTSSNSSLYYINIKECNKVNCNLNKATELNIGKLELLEHINNEADINIKYLFMCSADLKDKLKNYEKLIIDNLSTDKRKSTTIKIEEPCIVCRNALINKEFDALIFNKPVTLLNHMSIKSIEKVEESNIKNLIFEDHAVICLAQFSDIHINSMYISTKGADILAYGKCTNLNVENVLIDANSSTLLNIKLEADKSCLKYLSINIKDKTDYCFDNDVLHGLSIDTNQVDSIFLRGNFKLDFKVIELAQSAKKLTVTGKLVVQEGENIPDNISCREVLTEKQDRLNLCDYELEGYSALDLIRQFNIRDDSKSITELAEEIYSKYLKEV